MTLSSSHENQTPPTSIQEIWTSLLNEKLQPTNLVIYNDSDQHAGHDGVEFAKTKGSTHFRIVISSKQFEGLSILEQHRLIYSVLGKTIDDIHSIVIQSSVA